MKFHKFGKTGVQVSQLGFGCMRLPLKSKNSVDIDEAKATNLLHYAIDKGLNYIDTAYPYHGEGFASTEGGASEPFVGRALKDGYRSKVKIATKLPSWLIEKRSDMDKYLNAQLKRLQTDHIEFYLVHGINKNFWQKLLKLNLLEFLDSAVKDGRIGHIGFSFHDDLKTFKEVVDSFKWEFCQIQYNYIDEEFQAGKAGLEYAAERGLGIVVMEPLRGGALADSLPASVNQAFKASGLQRSAAEWAFRWLYDDERISVVLSGMNSLDQVKENIKVASEAQANQFSDSEKQIMKRVQKAFKERIQVNCTSCGYCLPCPHGVDIPRNFQIFNSYYLLDDTAREQARQQYKIFLSDESRASACVACGQCELHCPQQIKIIDELKKATKVLD
jgi:predicted aldo/keto reductase-like oxidoreductase